MTKNVLTIIPKTHAHPHTMKKTYAKFQNNRYRTERGVALTRHPGKMLTERRTDGNLHAEVAHSKAGATKREFFK